MDPAPPLPQTLERIETHIRERALNRSDLLSSEELAARTALPESTVHTLLQRGEPPADSVNDRVRSRIKALADARLARTGQRMSHLAGSISRQLEVSEFWARQVCSGNKMPSVELLHGLVDFFGVEGGEAFFTAPAPEALNRVLLPILVQLEPGPDSPPAPVDRFTAARSAGSDNVRGIALRQAGNLPEEQWNVLNATLKALLELDDREGDQ